MWQLLWRRQTEKVTGRLALEKVVREDFLEEMTLRLQLEKLWEGPGERRPRQRQQPMWIPELAKNLA